MKTPRLFWYSSALCLILASCDRTKPSASGSSGPSAADDFAAERAELEEQRLTLERERLEEERAVLEEEKEALRAEREARLAAREEEVESVESSLEKRQRQLDERHATLADREGELAQREANLSDQELELAGHEPLDDWAPDPEPEAYEPVADYSTFYDDLQPHGSWYETPDYGYVYQPTVVVQDSSWRPYTRGRWACTNLGWNWVSDEPFGWACFHYGRWTLLAGRGWVWVPGDEWAPSWVCWREGGEHVGWAPLPPETMCYRGRGWGSSVEADFGIGSLSFSFVQRRHMADPLWRHCLPLERNRDFLQQTVNITNIQFHRDRIVCGGPRYDRLRLEVGKPWLVYQIETDRFRALKDLNRRNANIRGNQLAVFAPNLNVRWNGQLKPSRLAGKWEDVKVVRAEGGIKPEWTERFRESRQKQAAQAGTKEGTDRVDAAKVFEANRTKVAAAQEKLHAKQQQQTESRRAKLMIQREQAKEVDRKFPGAVGERTDREAKSGEVPNSRPTLTERQRQAAERLRESRAMRNPQTGEPKPGRGVPAGNPARDGALPEGVTRGERPGQRAREQKQAERAAEEAAPPASMEEVRPQTEVRTRQRPEPAANEAEPSTRRQPREEARQQQEQVEGHAEEGTRRERIEEARRQQQEGAREKAEQARQQQLQMEEARRIQQEEAAARQEQEQAQREADERNRRQQQDGMKRQQQEQARLEQEESSRRQGEEQARQQERMIERQEERARQQEEARREQEERVRQQQEERARRQEERAREQEEARREAQEKARQQQEEQQRRQEESAREREEKKEERQRGG